MDMQTEGELVVIVAVVFALERMEEYGMSCRRWRKKDKELSMVTRHIRIDSTCESSSKFLCETPESLLYEYFVNMTPHAAHSSISHRRFKGHLVVGLKRDSEIHRQMGCSQMLARL